MVDITSSNGGDATKAIKAKFTDNQDKLTRDVIDYWFKESQDYLQDAARQRAEVGQEHGVIGRENQNLSSLVRAAMPPTWDESSKAWVFSYNHVGAVYQEFGAMPHEIRARKAEFLAFEWPDAPKKIKEQFEDTEGDLVFFKKINHPGVPAIGFVRYGRERTAQALRSKGYDVKMFEEGTLE